MYIKRIKAYSKPYVFISEYNFPSGDTIIDIYIYFSDGYVNSPRGFVLFDGLGLSQYVYSA